MIEPYIIDFTQEEVTDILERIKICVTNDKFIISQNENRKENIEFIADYGLTEIERKNILLRVQVDDFCHGLRNEKPGFEHEVLYVFCPQERLTYGHMTSYIDIYIKFNLINDEQVVVVSFHKRNFPIDYLFAYKAS